MGVRNEDALREAYEAAQPGVVQFSLRLGQSEPIHRALLALSQSEQAAEDNPPPMPAFAGGDGVSTRDDACPSGVPTRAGGRSFIF